MKNQNLPDTDEEILRNLYARGFDNQRAYNSMKFKIQYQKDNFPIHIDENIEKLLNCGGLYIHGRDKNLRPMIICNI